VVQFVDLPAGLRPELSVAADGPFVTDGRLQPVVGTDTVSFGYYVFFNVAPGLHRVELPGCDEGSTFWGPPSDGAIDIEVSPDAWLGLMPALCGF
jgi:hypothetical protein